MNAIGFVLVSLGMVTSIATAGTEPANREEQMRVLLERCGIFERLQEFPRQVFSGMGFDQTKSSSIPHAPKREAFVQAFNVEAMEEELIGHMAVRMDERTLDPAIQWFQSPIGVRITALERSTSTSRAWKGKQAFLKGLVHTPPSKRRVEQTRRLINASYLSRIDEELELTTAMALTGAMNAILPPEDRLDAEHIRRELQDQRIETKEEIQEERLMNFLYLYHRLTENEIEQYLTFLQSESGRQFNEAMRVSLRAVFQSAGKKIGTALGRALNGEHQI